MYWSRKTKNGRILNTTNGVDDQDLSGHLPTEAMNKGCDLIWIPPEDKRDPIVLEQRGKELYRWERVPSEGEVWDKCRELGLIE